MGHLCGLIFSDGLKLAFLLYLTSPQQVMIIVCISVVVTVPTQHVWGNCLFGPGHLLVQTFKLFIHTACCFVTDIQAQMCFASKKEIHFDDIQNNLNTGVLFKSHVIIPGCRLCSAAVLILLTQHCTVTPLLAFLFFYFFFSPVFCVCFPALCVLDF